MPLVKYSAHYNDMYEYICNRIITGIEPKIICYEIFDKFKPYIDFPDCDPESINNFFYHIVRACYYALKREFYEW